MFQVQVLMSLTDVPEMEEQIRNLLLTPYNQDSVSIATEDVQISRICESHTHLETDLQTGLNHVS